MKDQRQSNGVPLVRYQSSSESDSDDTDIQIPPSILDLEMEMRSESSDNVEIPVSLSNSPVHQSGKKQVAECRFHDDDHDKDCPPRNPSESPRSPKAGELYDITYIL